MIEIIPAKNQQAVSVKLLVNSRATTPNIDFDRKNFDSIDVE